MGTRQAARGHWASEGQIIDKLRSLTEEEKLDLWRTAAGFLGGSRFSGPADLFHETVSLLLKGTRHWPAHVPFCCFMRSAMMSVAGGDRRRHECAKASDADAADLPEAQSGRGPVGLSPLDALLERERVASALAALRSARLSLRGDPDAVAVLDGWLGSLSAAEIREGCDSDGPRYDAARKRALRATRRALRDERH